MSECIHGRPLYDYCGACASGYGNPDSRGTRDEIADALAITKKIVAAEAEPTGAQADGLKTTQEERNKWRLGDSHFSRDFQLRLLDDADLASAAQRDLEAARVERDARPTMAHHMAKVTDLRAQLASAAKDAARFNHLQNMPRTLAQALFWQFESRKQRARAIDEAIAALASDAAANKEREP